MALEGAYTSWWRRLVVHAGQGARPGANWLREDRTTVTGRRCSPTS
jgi:hypothetical protein